MTVAIAIICGTIAFCFVVAAVFIERHKRYWQDRGVDAVEARVAKAIADMHGYVDGRCDQLLNATCDVRKMEADVKTLLDQSGKFSEDISAKLEGFRRELVSVQNAMRPR